jgi:hypothetical protein
VQRILKWLTPLIAVGVAIFIVLFLVSINSNDQAINIVSPEEKSEAIVEKQKETWLDSFSKTQILGYFYPVNEVLIKVDLNENAVSHTAYKLSASLLDPYQLFCLEEELKKHELKYFLKKEKDSTELLIYSKEKEKLDSLIKVLKNYQIKAEIGLHKEDI